MSGQPVSDVVAVLSRTDLSIDMQNPAVGADEERDTTWKPGAPQYSVRPSHGSVGIAQDRIVDAERRREVLHGVGWIDTDAVVPGTLRLDGRRTRTQGTAFDSAPAGERLRKPGEHHDFAPPRVPQPVHAAIGARQREVRSLIADPQPYGMTFSSPRQEIDEGEQPGRHGRQDDPRQPQERHVQRFSSVVILVNRSRAADRGAYGIFALLPWSPNLRITSLSVVLAMLITAAACTDSPTEPSGGPPQAGSTIVYSAVGASDVTGVGSSVICPPYTDCPNGTGYAFVAARSLRGQGFTVNVTNHGIPTGVISRGFQDLGNQTGRTVLGNFIDQEAPFVPRDTTLITIFAGANETNIITAALGNGAGGSDPTSYIDQQVRAFGDDFNRLMSVLRSSAPNARYVILNVPNVAGMPFLANGSLSQRQAAQRASVRMTTTVINGLASGNAAIVDLMCDARLYDRGNYSSDGFHPNDAGYAVIGNEIARAATSTSYPRPATSCPNMTLVP
jgi:lysophospholipase L1-like esterase